MPWTKQEFIDFCTRCGVDPKNAFQEGKVDLRSYGERVAPRVKGAVDDTLVFKREHLRKKHGNTATVTGMQDAWRGIILTRRASDQTRCIVRAGVLREVDAGGPPPR